MYDSNEIEITESCGNVFADLELEDADILLTRAELGRTVRLILKNRGYGYQKAAEIVETDQSKIEQLMSGKYNQFSEGQLIAFLNKLDYTATIKITPTKKSEPQQQVVHV